MSVEQVVAYTCIAGRYERWNAVPGDFTGFDRPVLFSDGAERKGWEVCPLASPPRLNSGHDINRYHKLFPHRLFPEARFSVYMDGNVAYDSRVMDLVTFVRRSGAALGLFRHPDGRNLREEADVCRRVGKFDAFDRSRVDSQLASYTDAGFDLNQPIGANYLLVRDHAHPDLPLAMSLWWSHLFEYTRRDQMSLPYVLWQVGLPHVFLDTGPEIDVGKLIRTAHRNERLMRGARRPLEWLMGRVSGR